MKLYLVIAKVILILVFLAAGFMKLFTPQNDMAMDPNLAWAEDYSEVQIRIIALVEILCSVGLVVSFFVKNRHFLVMACTGILSINMIGAVATHLSRGEPIIVNLVLLLFAITVAILKFIQVNK